MDNHETESVCTFSDDESTPFQTKSARKTHKSRSRVLTIVLLLGNILLGILYANLWIRHKKLEIEVDAQEPELFPCRFNS